MICVRFIMLIVKRHSRSGEFGKCYSNMSIELLWIAMILTTLSLTMRHVNTLSLVLHIRISGIRQNRTYVTDGDRSHYA